jgi:hypothetical protein
LNKVIVKAYRTLCDPCAGKKKVCPSCCEDPLLNKRTTKEGEEVHVDTAAMEMEDAETEEVEIDNTMMDGNSKVGNASMGEEDPSMT